MREKPEQLIVNFLLMSVQFLENYEKYDQKYQVQTVRIFDSGIVSINTGILILFSHCRYKKQLITQENDEEEEINKALADKKKSCLLPGGLASKVLQRLLNHQFNIIKYFRVLSISPFKARTILMSTRLWKATLS